jgi:hypothetical protein
MGKRYAIFFDAIWDGRGTKNPEVIKGYFARKQPYFDPIFCEDINDANLWKTRKGAQAVIDHHKICGYKYLDCTIIELDVEEMKIIG